MSTRLEIWLRARKNVSALILRCGKLYDGSKIVSDGRDLSLPAVMRLMGMILVALEVK